MTGPRPFFIISLSLLGDALYNRDMKSKVYIETSVISYLEPISKLHICANR
jgi:hypothetical protein